MDKKMEKKLSPIADLLGYKRILQNGFVEMNHNNGFMQMYSVAGTGASSMGTAEVDKVINDFELFLSRITTDITVEITKLPAETHKQREYFSTLIRDTKKEIRKNGVQRQVLLKRLKKLRLKQQALLVVQETIHNTEYILFVYSDTQKELKINCNNIESYATSYGLLLEKLSRVDKEKIFFQFNNMNTKI